MEKLLQSAKTRPGADCGSDHELLIAKFSLKLKKVGKTTRPFRYDLNHPGLISFRLDWLDLLGVQGTLKSLLQHHSSKASILWHSAFFIVQLSHPYLTSGKTIVLTRWTFVGKVMSLLFIYLFFVPVF